MTKNVTKKGAQKGSKVNSSSFTKPKISGKRSSSFLQDLPHIMYGFGDVPEPLEATKLLLNEIVSNYIREFTAGAVEVARETDSSGTRSELDEHCMMCRVKGQQKKQRAMELLQMNEELKDAQKLDLFEKKSR